MNDIADALACEALGRALDEPRQMESHMPTTLHVLSCTVCQLSKGPSNLSPIVRMCMEGERIYASRARPTPLAPTDDDQEDER